jgi:hypothetical protein
MSAAWLLSLAISAYASSGLRQVSRTSCQVIPVNVGLGITTQVVFEQEPKVTLYADKKHFKVATNASSPRSLAIIPVIEGSELDSFRDAHGSLPSPKVLAAALDRSFKTNLFVFFDNNNQLMLELRFVDKAKADYILKVTQLFNGDCEL